MRLILSQMPERAKNPLGVGEGAGSRIADGDALADEIIRGADAAVGVGDRVSDAEDNQPDRSNVGRPACP